MMDDDCFGDEAAQAEGLTQSLNPPAKSIQANRDAPRLSADQGRRQGTASQDRISFALEQEREAKAWESWSKQPSKIPSWATPMPAAEGTVTAAQAGRIHAGPGRPSKDMLKDLRGAKVATQAAAKALAESREVAARMLALAKQQAAQTKMMAAAGKLFKPCATPSPVKRRASDSQIPEGLSPDATVLPIAAAHKRRATGRRTHAGEKSNPATRAADNKGDSLSVQGEESEPSPEARLAGESSGQPTEPRTFAGRYRTGGDKMWSQRIDIYNLARKELEKMYPGKKITKLPSANQQDYWAFLRQHQKKNCPPGTKFSQASESLAEAGKAYHAKLIEEAKAEGWEAAEQAT